MYSSTSRTPTLQGRPGRRIVRRAFVVMTVAAALAGSAWVMAQPAVDPLMEGFRMVEVA
jgi:hypothetical protein